METWEGDRVVTFFFFFSTSKAGHLSKLHPRYSVHTAHCNLPPTFYRHPRPIIAKFREICESKLVSKEDIHAFFNLKKLRGIQWPILSREEAWAGQDRPIHLLLLFFSPDFHET